MDYISAIDNNWMVELEVENDKLIDLLGQIQPMLEDYCKILQQENKNAPYVGSIRSLLNKVQVVTEEV